jgi:excisionase family DNA binding protein
MEGGGNSEFEGRGRETYTVPEACRLLGLSRSSGYELIRRSEFPVPVIRLGKRIVVPRAPLHELLGIDSGDGGSPNPD